MHVTVLLCSSALVLNITTMLLKFNYLTSVLFVMGGVSLIALSYSFQFLRWVDFKSMGVFVLLSNVTTTIIEKLMIVFDVWGFSSSNAGLIGLNFWGAPIEEYIYWWMAPVVVVTTYLAVSKRGNLKVKVENQLPILLDFGLLSAIFKFGSEKIEESAVKTDKVYLENQGVTNENSKHVNRKYERGSKVPVWSFVVAFVLACLTFGYFFFRGSYKVVLATVLIFVLVAYPNELYSLYQGYWVYNNNKMLGVWVLWVPLEEWFMYTASPAAGSMLFSAYREYVHKLKE